MRLAMLVGWSVAGMITTSATVWWGTSALPLRGVQATAETVASAATPGAGTAAHELHLPGTVKIDGRLGHAVVPAGAATDTYAYLELTADPQRSARAAVPLDLAIVIDRSGSMRGQRLANAIAAARAAVGRLRDGDRVSVVTYSTTSEVVFPPTGVTAAVRASIDHELGAILASGNTCISCGLETARGLFAPSSERVKRLLLLSDGEATAGVREVEGFRQIASALGAQDVSVTTVGVDVEYNEKIMSALALESNGRHYFVESADSLPRIFDQEVASLTRTLANDAELVFEPAPGVEVATVFDRPHQRLGRRVVVPLGSFVAGEQKTLLVQVRLPASAAGPIDVGSFALRYRDFTSSNQAATEGTLALAASPELTRLGSLDPTVELRLSRSAARAAIDQANQLFKAGRVDEARAKLRDQSAATRATAASAPKAKREELDREYAKQSEALDQADDGFGSGAAEERSGRARVRANEDWATGAAY